MNGCCQPAVRSSRSHHVMDASVSPTLVQSITGTTEGQTAAGTETFLTNKILLILQLFYSVCISSVGF